MVFFALAAILLVFSLVAGFTAFAFLNRRKGGGAGVAGQGPVRVQWVWTTTSDRPAQATPQSGNVDPIDLADQPAVQLYAQDGARLSPPGQADSSR